MNFKSLCSIWLPSWLALVPVGMVVVGPHDHAPLIYITGAAAFALPLSLLPALAAWIGLLARRKTPDRGRPLAAWLAVAATICVATSTLDLQKPSLEGQPNTASVSESAPLFLSAAQAQAKQDSERASQTAAVVGALGLLLGTVSAFMYFAEPRIGARRLVAILAVVGAIGTMAAIASTVVDRTDAVMMLSGAVSLTAGLVVMFLLLFSLAAARWVQSGFAADRNRSIAAVPGQSGAI